MIMHIDNHFSPLPDVRKALHPQYRLHTSEPWTERTPVTCTLFPWKEAGQAQTCPLIQYPS